MIYKVTNRNHLKDYSLARTYFISVILCKTWESYDKIRTRASNMRCTVMEAKKEKIRVRYMRHIRRKIHKREIEI